MHLKISTFSFKTICQSQCTKPSKSLDFGQHTGILGFAAQHFTCFFVLFWWWFGWLDFLVFLPDLKVFFYTLIKMKFLQLYKSGHLEAPFSCHIAKPYCLKYKMMFPNKVQWLQKKISPTKESRLKILCICLYKDSEKPNAAFLLEF